MIQPGASAGDIKVREIMSRELLSVEADWPIDKLTSFLAENHISGAPVLSENGLLVGVVSLTDIVRYESMSDTGTRSSDPHDYYLYSLERQLGHEEIAKFHIEHESSVTVSDIMTPMIYSTTEDARVREVADTMVKGRIHRVFVTNGKKLSGIVTALDMLRVIRDQ